MSSLSKLFISSCINYTKTGEGMAWMGLFDLRFGIFHFAHPCLAHSRYWHFTLINAIAVSFYSATVCATTCRISLDFELPCYEQLRTSVRRRRGKKLSGNSMKQVDCQSCIQYIYIRNLFYHRTAREFEAQYPTMRK